MKESADDIKATSRHLWLDLVLRSDRSLIIAAILVLTGGMVFWYSSGQIDDLSVPPPEYRLPLTIETENCGDLGLKVWGGAYRDRMVASVEFYEHDGEEADRPPLPTMDCFVRAVELSSYQPIDLPADPADSFKLFTVRGRPVDQFEDLGRYITGGAQQQEAGTVDLTAGPNRMTLNASPDAREAGVKGEHIEVGREGWQTQHVYRVEFSREWQPESVFVLIPTSAAPRMFFEAHGTALDYATGRWNSLLAQKTSEAFGNRYSDNEYFPMQISMSSGGQHVEVIRGDQTMEGSIQSERDVRFMIESGEQANKRESGLIMYSTFLGIGVALLTEAFVIVLAVLVLALGDRTWRRKRGE